MKLTEHVYLVGGGHNGFELTDPWDCHVYLVDGGSELALIDVGAGMGVPAILDNVARDGFDPRRIRQLLLTHGHADHAGGSAVLRERLGLSVVASREVAEWLRTGNEEAISLPGARRAGIYPADYLLQPCPVDRALSDGDVVEVGALKLKVVETPGHSAGHVCYHMQAGGRSYLFAGDAIFFGGRILLQNIWDCDLQAHIRSLIRLGQLEVDVLLPGHRSLALQRGKRHIQAAIAYLDRLAIPPNLS